MMVTMMMKGPLLALPTLGLLLLWHCCMASLVPFPGSVTRPSTTPRPKVPATYWVTFSTRIRPGLRLPVTVHLANAGHRASVTITLTNNSDHSVLFSQASGVTVVGGGKSLIINLEIPANLKQPDWRHWFQYAVNVVATGDVSFNQSQVVTLYEKAFSVFVQTDKAIYKPGQTVKIRALAMKPDLRVIQETMDIFIRDPQGNGIKQWSSQQGVGNSGVVEVSLPTSTEPPLGDWEIDVTVRGHTETKKFTIKEYVLPKFEATLDVSKVMVISDPGLRGKVLAKYTFGKPLTEGEVKVTVRYENFWDRYQNRTQPSLSREGMLNQNGEIDFFFCTSLLEDLARESNVYLEWRSLKVTAEVTDTRTGKTMEEESLVRFVRDPIKVEFLPLTPNTYKPGLRYTAYIKVTQADGTLILNPSSVDVNFAVSISVPTNSTPKDEAGVIMGPYPRPNYGAERQETLFSEIKRLTENGFLSIDVNVPTRAKRVIVQVKTKGGSAQYSAEKAASGSGHFLQITTSRQSPQVGQMAKLFIKTTELVNSKVIYQVYTKGVMVCESNASAVDAERQTFTMSFPVTANMAPNSKVLAFYFRPDGEVVADSVSFKVDFNPANQVQVSYSRQKVKPGQQVQMTVTARPDSLVFLLSVDKSVQLLKSGNDITQDTVSKELAGYDFGYGYHGYWRYMFIYGWPYPSHGRDAFSIFRDANVAMLTDGDLYRGTHYRDYYAFGAELEDGSAGPRAANSAASPPPPDSAAERVRKFFPETWLWDMILIGPSGQSVQKPVVPDTITTWLTSAFSVHPQHGLSVSQQPAQVVSRKKSLKLEMSLILSPKLTTFKEVFVSLDLPYSAIRGEDLCMKAFAFNYHTRALDMTMTMAPTAGINNIRIRRGRENRASVEVTRDLGQVRPNAIEEALFCFTPTGLGKFPLRVRLSGDQRFTDTVERMLLVEPEGTPRVTSIPVIVDVTPGQLFQHQELIQFPADTVRGSERITVSLAGDLLGPVFANIDDLLRMPYGCGEQNMLNFAPNVFLIGYMQGTGTYTPERAEKAQNYMMIGYQKEIKYQHNDGSFSAFGNRKKDEKGSMWLTAFVVKCFVQSLALEGQLVTIEPRILQQALTWMLGQQRPDGSFPEPGVVFNKNMQGGSAKGEALTAYVVIALAETEKNFEGLNANETEKLTESLSYGRTYLEQQLSSLTDPYDVAIVTYALHLTKSSVANQAFQLLMSKAVQKPLTLHWERPKPPKEIRYPWQRQTDAINIEMTSYALLTFLARGDVAGGLPVVRWMTSQRGPQGGFISTQDTVIGLQALALVAAEIYSPTSSPITVTVLWTVANTERSVSLMLNDTTRHLLQKTVIPIENNQIPSDVTIQASTPDLGNISSFAVAEVTLNYNMLEDPQLSPFSLRAKVGRVQGNNLVLTIRASRGDGQQGSMTILDVAMLTGYDVNEDHPDYNSATAKTTERKGSHYILYFEKMDSKEVKVTLPLVVTSGLPLRPEKAVIQVYDYYENDQQLTVKYGLHGRCICAVDRKYKGCPRYRRLYRRLNRPRF